MTRLDEIERELQMAAPHGMAYISQADALALVAIARKAIYVCASHEDKAFFEYHASIDALSEVCAPLRVTAPRQPPADVFDAMNLPAVNFPTTGAK